MTFRNVAIKFVLLTGICTASYAQKPNVVFILADDLGVGDISFNNQDPAWFRYTPNIDSICSKGIYFSNYYAHHLCSPTRAGLLTGMHYTKVGSGAVTGGTLHNDIPNVAKDFKTNGYVTGAFGKWHNGYPNFPAEGNGAEVNSKNDVDSSNNIFEKYKSWEWGEGVNAYGFDRWVGYYNGGGDYFNRHVNYHHEKDWWVDRNYRPDVEGYTTDLIGEAAVNFIETNKDTSFYCYVPMEAVHAPYHVKLSDLQELCSYFPGEWDYIKDVESPTTGRKISEVARIRCSPEQEFDYTLIDPEGTRFMRLIYSTMVYSMDKAIGDILAKLEEHNLSSNTIVFFSSDNGATMRGSNGIFQGWKHTLWEGGIHLPSAIWWPGHIDVESLTEYSANDNQYDGFVQYIDYYPTIMSLTNSSISATELDGIDFSENLLNRTEARPGLENPYYGINRDWGAIRAGKWKLHYNEIPGVQMLELYDLENDLSETTDLCRAEPEITDTLKALYNKWVYDNNWAFSYLPVSLDKTSNLTAEPEGDILEVKAWQTDSVKEAFFVRFSNFPDGGQHSGDRIEFDIYVADDSDNDSGFHYTPAGGVVPYFTGNNGVTHDSIYLNHAKWPRNQWIRKIVGYGNHAPIGGYAHYVCFQATEPGFTHFYLDNIIVRRKDGSVLTIWKSGEDFDGLRYRYQDIQYTKLDDVKKIEGFPFSDVYLNSAVYEPPPVFYVQDSLDDVTLYDSKIISLDGVFEVLNDPWAYKIITIEWTHIELLDVVYDAKTNRVLLLRKTEQDGESVVQISASHEGQTVSTSFTVKIATEDPATYIPAITGTANVYPNPATNTIHIDIQNDDFTVNLYNVLGQKVLTSSRQKVISVNGLNRGIYFLEIKTGENTELKKLQIN
jgi:arylsulfatase A-like enzyme